MKLGCHVKDANIAKNICGIQNKNIEIIKMISNKLFKNFSIGSFSSKIFQIGIFDCKMDKTNPEIFY